MIKNQKKYSNLTTKVQQKESIAGIVKWTQKTIFLEFRNILRDKKLKEMTRKDNELRITL